MVTSPPVTAAAMAKVPASSRSPSTRWSTPCRRSTPSISSRCGAVRSIWAPIARSIEIRSSTSGSRGGVLDHRRAARQGGGQHRVLGAHHRHVREGDPRAAQPAGRLGEVVAVLVLDLGPEGPHRLDMQVDRPPPDPVAAGVADDHAPEAGQERAEQDERGAHLHRRLERHEEPVGGRGRDLQPALLERGDLEADVGHGAAQDLHVADARDVAQTWSARRRAPRRPSS